MSNRVSLPISLRDPSQTGGSSSDSSTGRRPLGDVTFNRKNASVPQRGSGLRQHQSADESRPQPPKLTCRIPLGPLRDRENTSPEDDDAISPTTIASPSTPGTEEYAPRTPDDDVEFDYAGLMEDDGDEAANDMQIYAGLQGYNNNGGKDSSNQENIHIPTIPTITTPAPIVSSIESMESTPIPAPPRSPRHNNNNENTFPLSASPPVAAPAPLHYLPSFNGIYTPQVLSLLTSGIAVMEQEVLHHLLGEDPESMLADRKGGSSATRVLHLINFARKRVSNEVWLRMLQVGDFSLESRYRALKGMVEGIRFEE